MTPDLYIAGTGSYAAELVNWATASGRRPVALIELLDERRIGSTIHGLPVRGISEPPAEAEAVIGVGGDRARSWRLLEAGEDWRAAGALVHPHASIAETATLEVGVTVGPGAVIGAETSLGTHTIVSRGALVGHHVAVGSFVTLGPGVNVGGNTTLGSSAFLGIGCVVSNGISVGDGAIVAAGAIVIRDVPAGVRVQGVPARPYP